MFFRMEPAEGSPTGSATGAGAIDGAQLALRMVQAAESAATAAQAVSTALASQSSSSSSGGLFSGDSSQLYKLLSKPQNFDPSSREQEIAMWREWSWSFEQYLASLDSHYPDELKVIRGNLSTEIDQSVQDDKERQRGTFLYGLLSGVLKQRPLMLLKQVSNSNGFEAYRQLIAANEPQNKNRSMSLLSTIMSWQQFNNKSSLLSQIMRLDGAFIEYERLGSKLNDDLKAAILLRSVTGQLRTWLQLQVSETTTYNNVREHILAYERSTSKWTEQMVLGNDLSLNASQDTSGTMEVDRVFDAKGKHKGKKGKGKDKGKNKGKFDSAKGKGSGFKGSPTWNSGKGHSQWSGQSSGKGNGGSSNFWDGKGKGKNNKGKDKGKGRFDGTCHKCGKYGHKAETCRVRNISENGASGSSDPVKQTTEPAASNQNSASSAQQKVNRIVSTPIPSSSLVFSNEQQSDIFFDVSDDTFAYSDVFMIEQLSDVACAHDQVDSGCTCSTLTGNAICSASMCGGVSSSNSCIDEYFPTMSDNCDGFSYVLHPLFSYDDNEHYKDLVSECYRFDLYEIEVAETTCRIFSDSDRFRPCGKPKLHVRAVTSQVHDIVLDSGSDATVLPVELMDAGVSCGNQASELRDAQGNAIHVDDVRDICFDVTTTDGRCITIRDRAHFSAAVDKPLISYGKLLKRGWGIMPSQDGDFLVHNSGHKVNLGFKQNSIMMQGSVRVLKEVRRLSVDIPSSWQELGVGWYDLPNGTPLCMSHARHFVDVTRNVLLHEWPYRTTVAWHEVEGWQLLELCEKVFYMKDAAQPIAGGFKKLLTIMSKVATSAENLGIVVHESQTSSSGPSSSSVPNRFELFETDNAAPPPEQLMAEGTQASSGPNRPGNVELPASLAVHRDDGYGATNGITIAGVTVYPNSAISVLRAACHYLEVSQSGSKSKLWQRILATLDKRKMAAEIEAASSAKLETVRDPMMVHTAKPPDDEDEIMRHRLTHIPYKDWCEFCVASKGKSERHERDPTSLKQHELPVVSFDLCYTGVSGEAVDEKSNAKIVVLILHDSHSSAVHAVPVRNKGDVQHMVREASRFIEHLGHGDICLRCDQEPAMLNLQTVLQRALQRMGRRVVCENSKILDHASNSWVEKSIDRVRNTANVFLHQLRKMLEVEVPISHPLVAWAFVHSAWTLNRFGVKAGTTPYELISGHAYHGKLCQFAQPLLGFVGDSTNQKGDPKWRKCVFLTKTLNNDMFVVSTETGGLQLTKSVKALYPEWKEHIETYRTIIAYPWHVSGTLGNRIDAFSRKDSKTAIFGSGPGIDDEAGEEPPDDLPGALPDGSTLIGLPPPLSGQGVATANPQTTPQIPSASVPVSEPPNVSGGMDVEQAGQTADESATVTEPPAKKARISVRRVGDEEYLHVDVEMDEYVDNLNFQDEFTDWYYGDEGEEETNEMVEDESKLWQPYSELEPCLPSDELDELDRIADEVEIRRLTDMGVLTSQSNYEGQLGKPLSARMVRAWRKKTRPIVDSAGKVVENEPAWLRRSRLVGRDFNWLEARDDVYSPASSSSVSKLFPALAITNGLVANSVLGTLDVSDAFLQVPQAHPRLVTFGNQSFVILRCLPGQRDASKLWYQYFTSKLQSAVGATICTEQPCILKCGADGAVLIHVDDIMFIGTEEWVTTKLIPGLTAEFKLTHCYVKRHEGGSFEFLKRLHVIEPGYSSITIYPEPKHVKGMVDKYTKANGNPPKLCKTPCASSSLPSSSDPSQSLSDSLAAEYRSIVGIAMYMSQERFDIQYAVKTLACDLKNPTQQSWSSLGRLVGYLRYSEYFALRMERRKIGASFMQSLMDVEYDQQKNLLEVSTDSDWSGAGDMRSTSAAFHVLNSVVIHSTSRTQKCISLSSTEAEWYSASSGVCDAMFLHHILNFLTCGNIETLCLHTDNSAVKMLAVKLGCGRLRHIRGRLLWLQQRVACGELVIKQVRTLYNIADLNTKALNKDRFMCLLYMLNFVCNEERVGSDEYERMQSKEVVKSQVNMLCRVISENGEARQPRSHSANKAAKQVLRILSTFSLMSLTEGAFTSVCVNTSWYSFFMLSFAISMIKTRWLVIAVVLVCCLERAGGDSEALSPAASEPNTMFDGSMHSSFIFAMIILSISACVMSIICCMMNDGSDAILINSDDDNDEIARRERYRFARLEECSDPGLWQEIHHHDFGSEDSEVEAARAPRMVRKPSTLRCYMALSNAFGKLREIMTRDFLQQARGRAVLHQLFLVLREFDESGITEEAVRLLHQMVCSLLDMEAETNARSIGVPAIADVNVFRMRFPEEHFFVMVDESLLQDEEMDDATIQYFEGEMPSAHERDSPEHMASWMSMRLRRRICSRIVKGGDFKKYMSMNFIMRGVLKKCEHSEMNRRRCMHMMMNIDDLSDHDSTDDEDKTFLDEFLEGIPTADYLDYTETFQPDVDDYEENLDRDLGPRDRSYGAPENTLHIPAYSVLSGVPHYTIDVEELPEEAELIERSSEWVYYEWCNIRYRVRNFLTREELASAEAGSTG